MFNMTDIKTSLIVFCKFSCFVEVWKVFEKQNHFVTLPEKTKQNSAYICAYYFYNSFIQQLLRFPWVEWFIIEFRCKQSEQKRQNRKVLVQCNVYFLTLLIFEDRCCWVSPECYRLYKPQQMHNNNKSFAKLKK